MATKSDILECVKSILFLLNGELVKLFLSILSAAVLHEDNDNYDV